MSYRGDFTLGSTFNLKFTTIDAGIPTSVSGAFVAAYPDNSSTELTAGLVFSSDFDSRVGLNNVQVVATSGNGYVTGSNYDIVVISGTVGGKSLIGYVVGAFSIQARSAVGGSSSSSDPWVTNLPGSYTAGQAGHILASRMPTGTVLVGDKTGFSLSSPQAFNLIGNVSGTITNTINVINYVPTSGTAGDPWLTTLGGYSAGTAGHTLASRMPTGAVVVSSNQDKTGYSLSSPQAFNLIGNISGTITNTINLINNVTGSSSISNADMTTIASRVWDSTYSPIRTLTTSAGDSIPPAAGDDVFAIRGDTFIWDISGLDLTNLSKIQFSVKKKSTDADSESLIFSESGTGLIYIDGVAGTASNSAITYNSSSGTARIRVEAVEMAKLDVASNLPYDIQVIRTTGTLVSSPVQGNFFITWDSTRATS